MKFLQVSVSAGIGVLLALTLVSGIASARASDPAPLFDGPVTVSYDALDLPMYAHVVTGNVPVYSQPSLAAAGAAPVRSLGAGYLWVSLANSRPVSLDGQTWYQINKDEYVRADSLSVYQPSTFQGVTLAAQPDKPFGWMVYATRVSSAPGAAPAQDAPMLARYSTVTVYEAQQVGDWAWYRVGDDQWVEQRSVGLVEPSVRPEGVGPDDKWIEVNLYEQTLAAYVGDQMAYATLVSSGLPYWPTEQGLFRMWLKVDMAKMSGRSGKPDYYYLEDVPWTMYFNRDFALHAAYWHDRFGFPHSHGCVNLAPKDAKWLFDWTMPDGETNYVPATSDNQGTWVWVHQ